MVFSYKSFSALANSCAFSSSRDSRTARKKTKVLTILLPQWIDIDLASSKGHDGVSKINELIFTSS